MYPPADAVWAEQAGVALGRLQVELAEGQPSEAHDLGFDAATKGFHGDLLCRAAMVGGRRLLVEAFVDQALYHAWVGQGRGIAQVFQLVAGDFAQYTPHDLA